MPFGKSSGAFDQFPLYIKPLNPRLLSYLFAFLSSRVFANNGDSFPE